ncbi:MAG: hypothetical protein ACI8S6_000611 [Myxococcota bacterium]|jgi:hypothetical protein
MIVLPILLACSPEDTGPTADVMPVIRDVSVVAPSSNLPPEVISQDAHNNLDIVDHAGRMFFAFRTAPSHFASPDTVLYIVSTEDEQSWRFEGRFAMGTDLREPRFLSWDGRLWLYFAELGDSPIDFEPRGAWASEWLGPEQWTEPEALHVEGFIPWRARVIDGRPLIIGYVGGENIYDISGEPLAVHLLTTDDGVTLRAAVGDDPVIDEGGGSETDFAVLADGSLVAVERDEAGSETGWGSRICQAPAEDWSALTCAGDPRKYDSPLVFTHNDRVWLIGRRNVTDDGHYDLGMDDLSPEDQALAYQLDYWRQPKRCSLWEVDPQTLTVEFVLDLPSQGDTCFASALPRGEDTWLVYNYSSPVDGSDPSWLEGQNGETWIYRMILDFAGE